MAGSIAGVAVLLGTLAVVFVIFMVLMGIVAAMRNRRDAAAKRGPKVDPGANGHHGNGTG